MKAPSSCWGVSIPQPWASLICCDLSRPDARRRMYATSCAVLPWGTDYRGELVIQAAAEPDARRELLQISSDAQSEAVGKALLRILYGARPPEDKTWQDAILMVADLPTLLPRRAILARARLRCCRKISDALVETLPAHEQTIHQWPAGYYVWEFRDVRPVVPVSRNDAPGRLWPY